MGDTFRRKGLFRLHLDTGPVRPGEELNLPSLADWLRGQIAGADRGITLEQFPSGHSNLTYLLQIDGLEYVLRRGLWGQSPRKLTTWGVSFECFTWCIRIFEKLQTSCTCARIQQCWGLCSSLWSGGTGLYCGMKFRHNWRRCRIMRSEPAWDLSIA